MNEDKTSGLRKHAEQKRKTAIDKVDKAINSLAFEGAEINFNSVSQESGVSKSFLYKNEEVKQRIEALRQKEVNKDMNQITGTDKTSKAEDIIIASKDKKIQELKEENKKLKRQLEILRGELYCSS